MATSLKLKMAFADETARDIVFEPFAANAAAITNAKANIKALNTNPSAIATLYLSDGGANFTGVSAATITVETENEINLNGDE